MERQPLCMATGDPDDCRPVPGVSLGEDVHPVAAYIHKAAGRRMFARQTPDLDHRDGRGHEDEDREGGDEHPECAGEAGPTRTLSGTGPP